MWWNTGTPDDPGNPWWSLSAGTPGPGGRSVSGIGPPSSTGRISLRPIWPSWHGPTPRGDGDGPWPHESPGFGIDREPPAGIGSP